MSLRAPFLFACALALSACAGRRGVAGDGGTGTDGGGTDGSAGTDGAGSDAGSGTDLGTGGHDMGMSVMCPAAPAGVSADAAAALALENQVRSAMGVPCASMDTNANLGAERHCQYYASNRSNAMCVSNPHQEVSSCSMFVAVNFWDRMSAAGYTGSPSSEDMAFMMNGAGAVQQWIDSVWHRTPILDPWTRDIGYGNATGCDTMDFGVGASTPDTVVATYPYADQTGVPVDFDGRYEGPTPPMPASGWPSGYPIHVYLMGTLTDHTLTDASGTALPHTWLGPGDARAMGLLRTAYVMYSDQPLASRATYHVHVAGSNSAGPVTLDWSFTTQ